MAQQGELKQINGSWLVRYYDGQTRKMKKLGRVADYPTKDSIFPAYQSFMSEVNKPNFQPTIGTLLRDFVLSAYFPSVGTSLRGSTLRGYKAIWRNHLEPRLGHLRVRDIRVFDCQKAMESIIAANPELKQATLSRIKSFIHEIFAQAIRLGLRDGDVNPASGVKIRCANKKGKTFAYSLDEIKALLAALTEPSRVLMAVAAYTGLRRGEIVGLMWKDYDGKVIHVRRNICFGEKGEMSVELPKTEASEAPVPVIAPLRDILDAWKKKAEVTEGCWMFQAGFTRKKDHPQSLLDAARMTPLSPANVLRDVVFPALEKHEIEWLGYHAFRRGLATNLRALGVDDLTIMEILRHSDVSVTRQNYIKRVSEKSVEAMGRLEAELRKPVQSIPMKGGTKARKADAVLPVSIA
jgi:integrase